MRGCRQIIRGWFDSGSERGSERVSQRQMNTHISYRTFYLSTCLYVCVCVQTLNLGLSTWNPKIHDLLLLLVRIVRN